MKTSCNARPALMAVAATVAYIGHISEGTGGEHVMHSTPVEDQRGRTEGLSDNCLDSQLIAACHTDAPVLFTGGADAAESVARDIHESSGWRDGPFVVVDCSTSERDVDTLLSSLLSQDVNQDEFDGPGVRRSQDGVVFFREVGVLSPSARAKVAQWVAQVRPSGKPGLKRRVMASSAAPLARTADPLYHSLDAIHIQVDAPKEGD
jgi:DNA-binding NtrC family response regulator